VNSNYILKKSEGNYKDYNADGKWTMWHENGLKKEEGNFKDGKIIDGKETMEELNILIEELLKLLRWING
jgi:antitoxin component YwqK of YwqJK toxin-antitoxin module